MFGAALLGLVTVSASRDSAACGNAIEMRLTPTNLVADGERLVAEGKARGAVDHVDPIVNSPLKIGDSPLLDRALIVWARAVVRSDGELAMPPEWTRPAATAPASREGTPSERDKNLAEAILLFEQVLEKKKDDPIAQTDLAEAKARLAAERKSAMASLEALEKKGVMASAWGYAALAKLRAESPAGAPGWINASRRASDAGERLVSLERCDAMAKRKELCTADKLSDAMTKVPLPPSQVRSPHPGMRGMRD